MLYAFEVGTYLIRLNGEFIKTSHLFPFIFYISKETEYSGIRIMGKYNFLFWSYVRWKSNRL